MQHVKKVKPAIVVIDSFKVFDDLATSKEELRKFIYEIAINLMAWETTTLILGEYGPADYERSPLFSIVDGLIVVSQREAMGEQQRFFKVVKMRGTDHGREELPFIITPDGIEIFVPRVGHADPVARRRADVAQCVLGLPEPGSSAGGPRRWRRCGRGRGRGDTARPQPPRARRHVRRRTARRLPPCDRWIPKMADFSKDSDGNWWFTTIGKGNKQRQIAVSNAMLRALKDWRKHLNLSPLPSPADHTPLLPKIKGKGPIKSINHIRRTVQFCFDQTIEKLNLDGFKEEAATLVEATTHWLRHTGISDDVKIRPREHVRDDAGHSSSATTDKYIDVELRARHESAKKKIIAEDN